MIHLDTSVLIDVFCGKKPLAPRLRELLVAGERISLSALVLFEWRRGPRSSEQLEAQEALFPSADSVSFGYAEALLAASLYKRIKRPRGREVDIAIAACAVVNEAHLWTVNEEDFNDIPDLELVRFS
ncbi:MAG TPA: PIN domain-containing protein [Terriglobia bacterium]|nr:PIN domain-containing protein [Terriglobia bacterium]